MGQSSTTRRILYLTLPVVQYISYLVSECSGLILNWYFIVSLVIKRHTRLQFNWIYLIPVWSEYGKTPNGILYHLTFLF